MPELLPRIYLDNAATSWPKPEAVYTAVEQYLRQLGAPSGRGAYREATAAEMAVQGARATIARLLDVDDPNRIVFTLNGTDSLNLAIHGLVRPGAHVVTTVCEHNSVLRPLRQLEMTLGVEVTRVGCSPAGIVDPRAIQRALRPNTSLVAMLHASNVTGALQPVAEVGQMLRQHKALFLVDAAQSLGHVPVSVNQLQADVLAAPGHKGLLGPLGTGILYVGPGAEHRLTSTRQGGTGTLSHEDLHPDTLPEKCEAGNHNLPGIVGLAAAVEFLHSHGVEAIGRHGRELTARLLAGLRDINGVRILGPASSAARVAVVSFQLAGYDPRDVAATLDAAWRVQVRAGLHCAPRMHHALGSAATGGAVRLSPGPFTSAAEIDAAVAAIAEIGSAGFGA